MIPGKYVGVYEQQHVHIKHHHHSTNKANNSIHSYFKTAAGY
jgi:hypothetical protein